MWFCDTGELLTLDTWEYPLRKIIVFTINLMILSGCNDFNRLLFARNCMPKVMYSTIRTIRYKPPQSLDIPIVWNTTLLPHAPNPTGFLGSKVNANKQIKHDRLTLLLLLLLTTLLLLRLWVSHPSSAQRPYFTRSKMQSPPQGKVRLAWKARFLSRLRRRQRLCNVFVPRCSWPD